MPRTTLPPTPAASTEIKGKQNQSWDQADMAFTLPPSAVNDNSSAGSKDQYTYDDSSPISPTSPNPKAEPRQKQQNDLSLPPPPSRSRKIIQMKPKSQSSQPRRSARADAQSNDKPNGGEPSQQTSGGGGKKAASGTSAAGRKVARKTAHSIIERRRRSKMNEEFGVLKDLIPACRGCEMHKLAILQASIDYLRYLEQCVADLKANQEQQDPHQAPSRPPSSSMQSSAAESNDESDEADEEMEVDEPETEMSRAAERESSVSSISAFTAITSPAFSAQSHSHSYHRASVAPLPSPIFGPYYSHDSLRPSTTHSSHSYAGSRSSFSTQTSPNILPLTHSVEHMEDLNEASTALLMLNAKDRRNTAGSLRSSEGEKSGQRSMSVKDLLRS